MRWPRWGNPEMTRKAVFSEGRTPCVRIERPRECRGIPFAADGLTMSRWPRGHMPRSNPCHPRGRAEPAPPGVDGPRGDGFTGANPEMTRKAVFSEGRGLRVRVVRPHASRGIPFPPGDEARGRLAYRAHASVKPVPSYAGVRSPPLRETAKRTREGLTGANPEITRKVVFSEGRGLRVRVARPDASRGIPFPPGDEARGRLAYRAYASVKPVPSYPGVRSPPLHRVRPLDILNFGREGHALLSARWS